MALKADSLGSRETFTGNELSQHTFEFTSLTINLNINVGGKWLVNGPLMYAAVTPLTLETVPPILA